MNSVRKPLLTLAAVLLAASPAFPGDAKTRIVREPADTATIPWGEDAGRIGLIHQAEIERCGPVGFCVAEDGMRILDTVNARVVRVSPGRAAETVAEGVRGTAIAIDGADGFLVLEDRTVSHFANGRRGKAFPLPAGARFIEGYGAGVSLSRRLGVSASSADQRTWTVATGTAAKGFAGPDAPQAARAVNGRAGNAKEGLLFAIKQVSGNDIRILGSDADGKDLVSVPILMDGDPSGAVLFKCQDDAGNLYAEVERLKGGRAELEVHRYAPDGARLAVFKMPNDYFTTVYKKTEIAPDGTVYQLLTTPDGVKILRY
jgi:hypothetical protein